MFSRFLTLLLTGLLCQAVEAGQWELRGLSVVGSDNGVELKLQGLSFDGENQLENLHYTCPDSFSVYPFHRCKNATISATYQQRPLQFIGDFFHDFNAGKWSVEAKSADFSGLSVGLSSERQSVLLLLQQLSLIELLRWQDLAVSIDDLLLSGQAEFDLESHRLTSEQLAFSHLSYEHSEDYILAELAGNVKFAAQVDENRLQFELDVNAGEALFGNLYVDFASFPVSVDGTVESFDNGGIKLTAKMFHQSDLAAELQLELDENSEILTADLVVSVSDAQYINEHLLDSVLALYAFDHSQMSGRFDLNLSYRQQQIQSLELEFDDFNFLNEKRKFGFEQLSGKLLWSPVEQRQQSTLNWQNALLAGMPVAASQLNFITYADSIELLGKHDFPVFDGMVVVQQMKFDNLLEEYSDMQLDAYILPISLSLITEKMGWPIMSGKISGRIPGVVKKGAVTAFSGGLALQLFEGKMQVDNLSIERLFGVAPVIAGDIRFEELNLSQLTDTFDFGRITGLLSGSIADLRITNWKTDRLRAEIHTVKRKGIKQTISQQAIDHISSLGGIRGAISRSFLRFFEEFRYKKIKLSCVLHNSVCEIGGLHNTDQQFTIVEGGGIPAINIVGFVRKIDWQIFVNRLLNANYEN